VNDANVKVDVNAIPLHAGAHATAQGFDMTLFPIPGIFRGLAEQSVGRVKENCEKMKATSGEVTDNIREAYTCNAKGAADYGAKVIEISSINTQSALDFLTDLMATKSLSDIMSLSATQSRKNLEAASAQNKELWELAQRVATETTEPIKKSFAKVLQPNS
jgi:phasin